ncbi:MAG: hypothetical protein KDD45_11960 [Bdellovibrionales bacterium]|nr:hypothetical protein [Bdellovibrionales bacterium]
MTKLFSLLTSSLILFFITPKSYGAACCGGGFSVPSIISGDDQYQLATSYAYSKIDADVNNSGVWEKRSYDDHSKILKIDMASVYKDRFQFSLSIPIQQRNISGPQGGQSTGLGDIGLLSGYEYLPDWDYSPWRPKGIGFITLSLPTGKSLYDDNNFNGLNSRGRGYWSIGIGSLFTKTFRKWDAFFNMELHNSLSKNVANSQFQGTVKPGIGYSFNFGIGYNWKKFRLGHSILWQYEDPISFSGSINSNGAEQQVATGTIAIAYLVTDNLSSSLSYSDQSWYGQPTNTGLNKSWLIALQKRWPR